MKKRKFKSLVAIFATVGFASFAMPLVLTSCDSGTSGTIQGEDLEDDKEQEGQGEGNNNGDNEGEKPDGEKPPVNPPVDPEKPDGEKPPVTPPTEPEKPPVNPPVDPEKPDGEKPPVTPPTEPEKPPVDPEKPDGEKPPVTPPTEPEKPPVNPPVDPERPEGITNVKDIVLKALKVFDIYEFIPDTFKAEKRVELSATESTSQIDYKNSFANSNQIQTYGIGSQLDQFITVTSKINTILAGAKLFYDSATIIAEMYQTFFNKDPQKNFDYEDTTKEGAIKFKISLSKESFSILMKVATASAEIEHNLITNEYNTRIQLSDANALRVQMDNKGKAIIGVKALGTERMVFDVDKSNKQKIQARLYNFVGIDGQDEGKDIGITTLSVATITQTHLSIIGKKGDFFIPSKDNRNIEVYDVKTGKFIGSSVRERLIASELAKTNWYPLASLSGLTSIKLDTKNKETFLNNSSEKIEVEKTVPLVGSRKYDFEEKKVYIYKKGEKDKIVKQEITVPMFFIQDKFDTADLKEFNDANPKIKLTNKTTKNDLDTVDASYEELLKKYDEFKESTDSQKVVEFVGEQDPWFNKK